MKDFGRVGVLMGGLSDERAISLKSGTAVYEALRHIDIDALSIDLDTEDPQDIANILNVNNINICFIAMHGRFGEDGSLQSILEELELPYTCSGPEASFLSMDKPGSRKVFKERGLSVPDYTVVDKQEKESFLNSMSNLDFSLVVKPANSGSSIGLSIVDDYKELEKALEWAWFHSDKIIVEKYISGRELTVGILDDEPLPIIEIIPKLRFFNYEAKYTPGFTEYIIPAKLSAPLVKKVSEQALLAHRSLGCFGCSRVDLILSNKDNTPYILEVNSIPGLTSLSLLPKAAKEKGIDFPQFCLRLIESAIKKHSETRIITNTDSLFPLGRGKGEGHL